MTEGEANKLSDCGYGCHIIGGPWISTNPNCPECNGNSKDDDVQSDWVDNTDDEPGEE